MKFKYRITIVFIILSISECYKAVAQETTKELSYKIMWVPQYLASNGIRIDYEKRIRPNSWLIISPYIFYKSNDYNVSGTPKTAVSGGGLEIGSKEILGKSKNHNIEFYYGYSGFYQQFSLYKTGDIWHTYLENGNNVLKLNKEDYKIGINKLGLNLFLGAQVYNATNFYFDAYMGVGLRYSTRNEPFGVSLTDEELGQEYAYTGTIFLVGFKVGLGR